MTGGRTCYGGVFSSPRLCFWLFLWTTTVLIGEVYTLTPPQGGQNDDAVTVPQSPPTPEAPVCEDVFDNCTRYAHVGCTLDIYRGWAKMYCRKHCRLCGDLPASTTTEAPTCEDSIDDCSNYVAEACTLVKYKHWANKNCRKHCKLCGGPPPPPCVDTLTNCAKYDSNETCTKYETWARDNCRRTCRYCTESQLQEIDGHTTAPPTTTETTPSPCVDKRPNCAIYQSDTCTNATLIPWATDNCRRFCRFCTASQLLEIDGHTTPPPPTAAPCVDTIPNCADYDKDTCTSAKLKPWASAHCRRFCRFCTASQLQEIDAITTTKLPCVNKISNCDIYDSDTCTKASTRPWAEDNCNKFCGFCTGD